MPCVQDEVDHQRDTIRPLVTAICNLAKANSSTGSAARAPTSGPKPQLLAACLSALSAYVALCNKLKVLPEHLDDIEEVVLASLDLSTQDAAGKPMKGIIAGGGGCTAYSSGKLAGVGVGATP